MARPVILGNGSLTVGLDEQGLVHDFYYPYVGLDNLTTARSAQHKIGIWVDGAFSWIDDGSWHIKVDFDTDAMISLVRMRSDELGLELVSRDFVDSEYNAFCRKLTLTNLRDETRDARLFMHQVFEISRGGRADTGLYEPEAKYILDYKGRCSLLIYGQDAHGVAFDQFAIGNYGIEGKEGTFRDAEDGELSGSAVEHGGVDSVIRLPVTLAPHSSAEFDYWIVAADSQHRAEIIHDKLMENTLAKRLELTRDQWKAWLKIGAKGLSQIDEQYRVMAQKSLMLIKVHTDKRGGIIASCDSSIYNYGRDYYSYVWPRDGAYAMWPLIRLGYMEEPRAFFEFCRDIINPDGYLMHKYQPDRAIGSTWHPLLHGKRKELAIQEDETAIVLFMLGEYQHYSHDVDFVRNLYATFIQPAANFLASFIDPTTHLPHASYDLWEEKFLTSTYTTATVYQALIVAANFAESFEFPDDASAWRKVAHVIKSASGTLFDPVRMIYQKGFLLDQNQELNFDSTLDISSLYGPMMFDLDDSDSRQYTGATLQAIESTLLNQSPSAGLPRYEHDHYFESNPAYMGNPWFVSTLWLAQYHIRTGEVQKARDVLQWTMNHALPSGALSEQINPTTGAPVSVTPLVWSHAEFVNTVLDLVEPADS